MIQNIFSKSVLVVIIHFMSTSFSISIFEEEPILARAVRLGWPSEVERILRENPAEAKEVDARIQLVLTAVVLREFDVVKVLVKNGININTADCSGNTALHVAASNNARRVIEFLIENGAEIEARDEYGNTPLLKAAQRSQLGAVQVLLEKGAEIDVVAEGKSALSMALIRPDSAVAQELIKRYASVGGLEEAVRALPGDLLETRREALKIILDDPEIGLPTLPTDLLDLIIE